MPKIIENIREKLLEEARRQVMQNGYSSMTIRSVAKACGASVGTVYNYFSSKDMLVASFMLEDWKKCLHKIYADCDNEAISMEQLLTCICDVLADFTAKYTVLFQDKSAGASFATDLQGRHRLLRSQISEPILKVLRRKESMCRKSQVSLEFLSEFLAENVLTWTVAGRNREEIVSILLSVL